VGERADATVDSPITVTRIFSLHDRWRSNWCARSRPDGAGHGQHILIEAAQRQLAGFADSVDTRIA
jgi:hypothetical protein